MWVNWTWDSWIKWQTDWAVGLGCNSLRLIGNVSCVTSGAITLDTYLARWTQWLDYTATTGMLAYPCGGDLGHWGSTTDAEAVAIYQAWADLVSSYDHVFAIDVTNEAGNSGVVAGRSRENIIAVLGLLTDTLRARTNLPLAHSRVASSKDVFVRPTTGDIALMSDFLDFHVYYTPSLADFDPLFAHWWSRMPVIFGEFGAGTDLTTEQRVARYTAAKTVFESRPEFAGGLAWAITDLNTTPAQQWGLVTPAGVRRDDIADEFLTLPTTRS